MDVLAGWSEFHVAMVGATAALAGLVIVAASVNIDKVVAAGSVTSRLAASIATLVVAIVVSGVALVPALPLQWFGAVTVVTAVPAAGFQVHATRTSPATDRARLEGDHCVRPSGSCRFWRTSEQEYCAWPGSPREWG